MVGRFTRSVQFGGGLFLLSLAACGGRTIDDGDYGTSGSSTSDGGSSGSGGNGAGPSHGGSMSTGGVSTGGAAGMNPGTGGSAGTGTGGSAGTGTGGVAGVGGIDPAGAGGIGAGPSGGASTGGSGGASSVLVECSSYCKDAVFGPCPLNQGTFDQCYADCSDALLGNNGSCYGLGTQLLACLRGVLEHPPGICSNIIPAATALCQPQILSFGNCQNTTTTPPPVSCSEVGSAGDSYCSTSKTCTDGTAYKADCKTGGANLSYCTCGSANGATANLTLNESVSFACDDAMSVCGAPAN